MPNPPRNVFSQLPCETKGRRKNISWGYMLRYFKYVNPNKIKNFMKYKIYMKLLN